MGLSQNPAIPDHWAEDDIFTTPWIKRRMSYKTWNLIHQSLLYDIDYIEEEINAGFQSYWTPFPHVAIDEGMIPFKGRYRYRQHIKNKPKATGIKFYALCDQRSFVWSFWTYRGSQPPTVDIVCDFTKKLPNSPHFIYTDSYYGSIKLAYKLNKQGHKFTFTSQANRPAWLFSGFLLKKLKRHSWRAAYDHTRRFTALSFYDCGKCNFFSNMFDGKSVTLTHNNKKIPALVADYRKWYGAVDTADANHLRYLFPHKKRKRTTAMLLSFLKICVSNAWILYMEITEKNISQRCFIRNLVHQLSPEAEKIPETNGMHLIFKSNSRGSCHFCASTKNARSSTPYKCGTCDIFLHADCFLPSHTQ
jgi:hypothetical protein